MQGDRSSSESSSSSSSSSSSRITTITTATTTTTTTTFTTTHPPPLTPISLCHSLYVALATRNNDLCVAILQKSHPLFHPVLTRVTKSVHDIVQVRFGHSSTSSSSSSSSGNECSKLVAWL